MGWTSPRERFGPGHCSPLVLLVVHGRAMDAQRVGGCDDLPDEPLGAADVDVALTKVRDEPAQELAGPAGCASRTDELVERAVKLSHERLGLITKDELLLARRTHDDDRTRALRQVLEKGANGRDPDASGDKDDLLVQARVGDDGAVRTLDGDPGAGTESGHRGRVVTDLADGQPQVGRPRQRRHRVRMRLPPEATGEEAPREE